MKKINFILFTLTLLFTACSKQKVEVPTEEGEYLYMVLHCTEFADQEFYYQGDKGLIQSTYYTFDGEYTLHSKGSNYEFEISNQKVTLRTDSVTYVLGRFFPPKLEIERVVGDRIYGKFEAYVEDPTTVSDTVDNITYHLSGRFSKIDKLR